MFDLPALPDMETDLGQALKDAYECLQEAATFMERAIKVAQDPNMLRHLYRNVEWYRKCVMMHGLYTMVLDQMVARHEPFPSDDDLDEEDGTSPIPDVFRSAFKDAEG